jgi:membrane protein YdbS with pleckstrin-like domain
MAKVCIILLAFWLFVALLYNLMRPVGIHVTLIEGMQNSMAFTILVVTSIILVAVITFIVSEILRRDMSVDLREDDLAIRSGIVASTEISAPYTDIKEAKIVPSFMRPIDQLFKIDNVAIEWKETISLNGVKDAKHLVMDINSRVAAHREKKPTVEELLKEVASLRAELDRLRGKKKEEAKVPKKPEERKRFFKPLEEEV